MAKVSIKIKRARIEVVDDVASDVASRMAWMSEAYNGAVKALDEYPDDAYHKNEVERLKVALDALEWLSDRLEDLV